MAPESTKSASSADPLLPSKPTNQQPPIASSSALSIKVLAYGRIVLGASSLIAPSLTFALFKFPIPASMTILPRLFGIREIMVGEFLLTADDKSAADAGRREMRKALWMNMAVDTADLCGAMYGVATGTVGRLPGGLLAGGAALCLGLGGLGMRGL